MTCCTIYNFDFIFVKKTIWNLPLKKSERAKAAITPNSYPIVRCKLQCVSLIQIGVKDLDEFLTRNAHPYRSRACQNIYWEAKSFYTLCILARPNPVCSINFMIAIPLYYSDLRFSPAARLWRWRKKFIIQQSQ